MDKRLITPVVVCILISLLLIGYMVLWAWVPIPPVVKIIILVGFVALIGVMVFVTIERLKEIRSGETDDLSNY